MICESEQQSDLYGFDGEGLGDVNGDGFNDFAITDPYFCGSGSIYIYYGGNPPDSIPDVIIRADNMMNHIGWCIAPLGDVNQDGYDDFVTGDPRYGIPGVTSWAGVIAIYYGGNPPDTIPETIITGPFRGASGDSLNHIRLEWR